jgi:hypothetical protein
VLVYGGNGSLGQSMISAFQAADWRTISVDYFANSAADHNILLSHSNDWKTNTESVTSSLDSIAASLSDDELLAPASPSGTAYLAAVVAVAGGWKGSSISSPALFDSTDAMPTSCPPSPPLTSLRATCCRTRCCCSQAQRPRRRLQARPA